MNESVPVNFSLCDRWMKKKTHTHTQIWLVSGSSKNLHTVESFTTSLMGENVGETGWRVSLNQSYTHGVYILHHSATSFPPKNLSQFHKKILLPPYGPTYSGVTYKFVVARTCAARGNIYRVGRMRVSATSGAPDLKVKAHSQTRRSVRIHVHSPSLSASVDRVVCLFSRSRPDRSRGVDSTSFSRIM